MTDHFENIKTMKNNGRCQKHNIPKPRDMKVHKAADVVGIVAMSGKATPNKSVISVQMFCRFDAGWRLQYYHYPLATFQNNNNL